MVRVIVENTTFPKANGAAWDGTLVDKWVALNSDSTMMSSIVAALDGHTVEGADSGYISSIDGLSQRDGGHITRSGATLTGCAAPRRAPAALAWISAATGRGPIPR